MGALMARYAGGVAAGRAPQYNSRMSRWIAASIWMGCFATLSVHAQDATVVLGKQRAAASPLEWEVQEANHPKLGKIRFAYIKNLIETPVGSMKVYSRAYVSCDANRRKIAIELTNTISPEDADGLKPKTLPRLVCSRLPTPNNGTPVREELLAPRWEVSKIGDVLAHSLTAFPLRECFSIDVVQDVELPRGWSKPSAAVTFELTPYGKELDEIFATCGEVSAYAQPSTAVAKAPAAVAATPAPPAKSTPPAKPAPEAAPTTPDGWRQARAVPTGRSNLRSGPTLQSPVSAQLDPGMPVLAQKAEGDWWRVRTSSGGKPVEGYVRQDRLVFK